MLCRAFIRLVVAMEESAMTVFICPFSASRLNGFLFPLALSLSFFLSEEEELPKKDPDKDEDLEWPRIWVVVMGAGVLGPAAEGDAAA
jgi:hypothetical protein